VEHLEDTAGVLGSEDANTGKPKAKRLSDEPDGVAWNAPLPSGGFVLGNEDTLTIELDFTRVLSPETPE
jgi:hypothetical protein